MTLEHSDQGNNLRPDLSVSDSTGEDRGLGGLVMSAGDVVLLLMFAVIGRWSHHEFNAGGAWATLGTAAPFVAGWTLVAAPLRVYAPRALDSFRTSMERLLITWPIALAVALIIRSIVDHEVPAPAFVVVALLFNLLTLTMWRAAFMTLWRARWPVSQ